MPELEKHLDGALVRAARQARGLSQEALAHAVGLTLSTVQRVEAGEVDPLTSTALALARALGCPVEALVRGTGLGNGLAQAKADKRAPQALPRNSEEETTWLPC